MDLKTSDGGFPDPILRRVARYVLEKLHVYGLYSLSRRGPLHDDGWFRSFEEHRSVDRAGNPLPFITYPAIEFLLRRVRGDMSVFEYGAGASTLWWAARVKEVIACEHDRGWYERSDSVHRGFLCAIAAAPAPDDDAFAVPAGAVALARTTQGSAALSAAHRQHRPCRYCS